MSHIDIFPLFPSAVFVSTVEGNLFFDQLKNENYQKCEIDNLYVTRDKKILNRYPELKDMLMDKFNCIITDILKYECTKFDITTSWLSKSLKNCQTEYHSHQNCFYAGVLYFQDFDNSENAGDFQIDNMGLIPQTISPSNPTEYNIYNSPWWNFKPEKNMVIFFPSYLKHRMGRHNLDDPRYCLAFNIMPYGVFGFGDSSISLELNNNDSLQSIL